MRGRNATRRVETVRFFAITQSFPLERDTVRLPREVGRHALIIIIEHLELAGVPAMVGVQGLRQGTIPLLHLGEGARVRQAHPGEGGTHSSRGSASGTAPEGLKLLQQV